MKKFLFVCLFALVSSTSIFAVPRDVSEKVLKIFHEAFPEVKQPSWYTFDNYYEVYFTNSDNSSCRIDYNTDGTIMSTKRYYGASELSPFIKAKVNEKYPGKKIFGITEVNSEGEFTYHIILQDDKNVYNIKSDATGNINVESKLRKADQ